MLRGTLISPVVRMAVRGYREIRTALGLVLACAAVLVLAGGCSQSAGGSVGQGLGTDAKSAGALAPLAPKLENGDKLRITVFNEQQLSGEFVVDAAGSIAFPLVGQIMVAGLDAREVEQKLSQSLSGRYLVNPKIGVEILSQRPFYILGEVTRAGEYPYRSGLNVVGAIALAGGYSPRAAVHYVIIRRANGNQQQEFPVQPSTLIFPGDMITVPERMF
jgi:polysaccharide export outer membrane protein